MTIQTVGSGGIAGISSTGTSSQKAENKSQLGQGDFLNLLITQLKNQDPLNPLDSVDFTAQLAQFSSLDELSQIGDTLASIKTSFQLQEGDQLVNYMGKALKASGNTMVLKEGKVEPASLSLDDDADVQVYIYTPDGALVRSLNMGWQKTGEHQVAWDGRDNAGNPAPEGNYTFQVVGTDMNGQPVSCHTFVAGEVTGVKYESGKPYLVVGGREILPENILEVY